MSPRSLKQARNERARICTFSPEPFSTSLERLKGDEGDLREEKASGSGFRGFLRMVVSLRGTGPGMVNSTSLLSSRSTSRQVVQNGSATYGRASPCQDCSVRWCSPGSRCSYISHLPWPSRRPQGPSRRHEDRRHRLLRGPSPSPCNSPPTDSTRHYSTGQRKPKKKA